MSALISLDLDSFSEPGLYLRFEDGRLLTLTPSFIEQMKQNYLNNPELLPEAVRKAPAYAPCSVCPKRDTALICHAIPTVFPFLEDMDRFLSIHEVLALYRSEPEMKGEPGEVHLAQTTVQRALQYVSILSLMCYCEVGRLYFKYFSGVIPIMNPLAIVERVYLNLFWDLRGNPQAIKAMIAKMRKDIDVTMACQIARLHLFCKSDAFLNAFITTHILTQFLEGDMDQFVRERFEKRFAAAPDWF
jgi:hypothetical protein